MTYQQLYLKGKQALEKAGNECPAFDSICLFARFTGFDRQGLAIHGGEDAPDDAAKGYLQGAAERAAGRPLQYILGEWPFLDLDLKVREGVLIPREETELLVRTAAQALNALQHPLVYDLCGGTGAVALGLASLLPDAEIVCAELYSEAFACLEENAARYGQGRVHPQRLDVLNPPDLPLSRKLDAIVSNPPYIAKSELPGLQLEVQREPQTALDGGADGLLFYRAIAEKWVPLLTSGGFCAVEIGETQGEAVSALFLKAGLESVQVLQDFNGLDRVVFAKAV